MSARGQAARSSSTASRSQETWIALLSIGAITLHLVLKLASSASPAFAVLPLYMALLIGGAVLLRNLGRDILNRKIGADAWREALRSSTTRRGVRRPSSQRWPGACRAPRTAASMAVSSTFPSMRLP